MKAKRGIRCHQSLACATSDLEFAEIVIEEHRETRLRSDYHRLVIDMFIRRVLLRGVISAVVYVER